MFILNRGAHWEDDCFVLKSLQLALEFIETRFPKALTVWRTTPPGHENHLLLYNSKPLSVDTKDYSLDSIPYNWGKIMIQNSKIVRFLLSKFPKVIIFDVAPVLALRHDHHKDGYHYTLPGPPDFVTEYIFTFLPELFKL